MRVGMAGEDWQKLVNAGFTPALTKNHEVVLVRPVQRDDNQPATRAFQNALARGDWRAMMKGAPKD